jgi:hypothetical protein
MSYSGLLIAFATAAGLVSGCASAGSALDEGVDAGVTPDAPRSIDAPITPPIDAPIDAPITPPIDAPPGCTTMTINLLANPSFDMTPIGMGWVEAPIDPMYPIITADGTLVQSAPNKAWMGGLARANANDTLYQEVTVPAGATALRVEGFYEVRTQELFGVYDRGKVELVQPGGALIQQAFATDNTSATTAWTPFAFNFSSPQAGATVRLRLSTASDATDSTSFFFDSLKLNATVCQ